MAAATAEVADVTSPGPVRRVRMAAASVGAALLGATPHVLHHAGPLAGAALFAGIGGTLLFGAIGLAAATPILLKLRRRTGSWRAPAGALVLFTTLFALSSFVVAPALTGTDDDKRERPPVTSNDDDHGAHHP